MGNRILVQVLLLVTLFFTGCNKEAGLTGAECLQLKEAIQQDDVNKAGLAVSSYIKSLADASHTNANLQQLAAVISSGQCSLSAEVICFGCIYTLPAQSEIRIRYVSGTDTLAKTIDISSKPGSTAMVFINMHD